MRWLFQTVSYSCIPIIPYLNNLQGKREAYTFSPSWRKTLGDREEAPLYIDKCDLFWGESRANAVSREYLSVSRTDLFPL